MVANPTLVPLRARFEASVPSDARVIRADDVPLDELRDADVYVGSSFAALSPETLVANKFHHEQSIAEYIVAAAVMLRRDFLWQDRELRRNTWATSVYDDAIPQPSAGGARIGFVGFGHIGQRAWNLFRAFGCTQRP